MKTNRNVKNKLKQVIVNKDSLIELDELHIILLEKTSTGEQKDIEQIKKQFELYELYKNLNPRYFEEVIPLKEAISTFIAAAGCWLTSSRPLRSP